MKILASILLVLCGVSLTGCLSDNVTAPEVKARNTFPPGIVYYKALNATNLEIRWTRSVSDTQLNFKGYLVVLSRSVASAKPNDPNSIDSTYGPIDTIVVYKNPSTGLLDTSCTFTVGTPFKAFVGKERYTVFVYGVRYPPQVKPDSIVTSETGAYLSFFDDPDPVLEPTAIYASSGGGATSVNLFWKTSASEANPGFAGYVIRYIDTIKTSGAVLVTAVRFGIPKDTGVTTPPTMRSIPINVPANPQTLTFREYPYKFWIKAIRRDSVESADSIGIVWSGAERAQPLAVRADTGVFVGQVNTTYAVAQTTVDNPAAEFKLHYDGTNTTVIAIGSTMLSTRIDTATLDNTYFSAPMQPSDFGSTTITLPPPGFIGSTFYALLPGGGRARIQVVRDATSGEYINPTNGMVTLTASFQPVFTGWPFF
jgi:hypothetical protein